MRADQRVLLIASGGESDERGFRRTVRIALALNAALHVCLLDEGEGPRPADADQKLQWMRDETERAGTADLAITVEWLDGEDAAEEILAHVVESSAGLVIKYVADESSVRHPFRRRLAWKLLRECPVPLLLMHGAVPDKPRRVLAAIDIDDEESTNRRIVDQALAIALQCDAELDLVYAFDQLPALETLPPLVTGLSADQYEALNQAPRASFHTFADGYSVPQDRRHFLVGKANHVLPVLVRDLQTDLLVLGSIQRSGLDRLISGSTPKSLLDRLECDLLTVHCMA